MKEEKMFFLRDEEDFQTWDENFDEIVHFAAYLMKPTGEWRVYIGNKDEDPFYAELFMDEEEFLKILEKEWEKEED